MLYKHSDWILIAHGDSSYAKQLRKGLKKQGMEVSEVVCNAFEALGYVLLNQPFIALLEHDFSYLSAMDITNAIKQKHMDTQVIHILPKDYQGKLPETHFFYENDSIEHIEECINRVAQKIYKKAIRIKSNMG